MDRFDLHLLERQLKSIHLEKFLNFPKNFENLELNSKWSQLLKIRDVCNMSIEEKRGNKEIGSSLEASLIVKMNKENIKKIEGIDLSELCITSSVEITDTDSEEIKVITKKATGDKCPVCWKISEKPCERHKN